MNTKARFLVMSYNNETLRPYDYTEYAGSVASLQKAKSPSFLDEGEANAFAKWLAETNEGENFYVAKVVAAVGMPSKPILRATTTPALTADATPGE